MSVIEVKFHNHVLRNKNEKMKNTPTRTTQRLTSFASRSRDQLSCVYHCLRAAAADTNILHSLLPPCSAVLPRLCHNRFRLRTMTTSTLTTTEPIENSLPLCFRILFFIDLNVPLSTHMNVCFSRKIIQIRSRTISPNSPFTLSPNVRIRLNAPPM